MLDCSLIIGDVCGGAVEEMLAGHGVGDGKGFGRLRGDILAVDVEVEGRGYGHCVNFSWIQFNVMLSPVLLVLNKFNMCGLYIVM